MAAAMEGAPAELARVLYSSCSDLGMDEHVMFTCDQVLSAAVATRSTHALLLAASAGMLLTLLLA
jgi:hypothetical protein